MRRRDTFRDGMSNLFPRLLMPFTYNFKKLLKDLYDNNDVFTIGASIYQRQNGQFGELIMNASFSQTDGIMKVNNQSYLAFLDEDTGMCALESIINSNPDYYPYGNLFISEGQSGQVLKVQAKKRINMGFLSALQNALYYEYSFNNPRQLVGLGGIFVMKNGRAKHHVLPYSWNARLKAAADIHNWLHYFELDTPLIAVGTLVNSSEFYKAISRDSKGNRYVISESRFHAFSYQKKLGGHFYMDDRPNNTVEYLRYFYPACMLYILIQNLHMLDCKTSPI